MSNPNLQTTHAQPWLPERANPSMEPLVVSKREAAKVLSISERTLHNILKEDRLPHLRIGQRVLVRATSQNHLKLPFV
jgi:excisionase family DNA binding protein